MSGLLERKRLKNKEAKELSDELSRSASAMNMVVDRPSIYQLEPKSRVYQAIGKTGDPQKTAD